MLFHKSLGVEWKSTSTLFQNQITWEDLVSLLKPTVSTSPLLAAHFNRLCNLFPVRCSIRSDCTGDGPESRETPRPSSCKILKRRRGLDVDVLPASPVTLPVPHTVMGTATGLSDSPTSILSLPVLLLPVPLLTVMQLTRPLITLMSVSRVS